MATEINSMVFTSKTELCEKIDEVLLQFFSTLSEFYSEQYQLEERMKSGFLAMSRARYNMGITSVGIQQCDETRMAALYKVKVTDDVLDLDTVTNPDLEATEINRSAEPDTGGVRKRNINKDGSSTQDMKVEDIGKLSLNEEDKDVAESTSNTKKEKSTKTFDPIKWFGVLVPQSLRQSQKDFQKSLELAITAANFRMKLNSLREQYVSLMKKKEIEFSD